MMIELQASPALTVLVALLFLAFLAGGLVQSIVEYRLRRVVDPIPKTKEK